MSNEKVRQKLKDQIKALDQVRQTLKELMASADSEDWLDRFEASRNELIRVTNLLDVDKREEKNETN